MWIKWHPLWLWSCAGNFQCITFLCLNLWLSRQYKWKCKQKGTLLMLWPFERLDERRETGNVCRYSSFFCRSVFANVCLRWRNKFPQVNFCTCDLQQMESRPNRRNFFFLQRHVFWYKYPLQMLCLWASLTDCLCTPFLIVPSAQKYIWKDNCHCPILNFQ